jgi:hypothetical protein
MEFEARRRKRGMPIIGQSTSDSKTILAGNHPFLMLLLLGLAFNRANTPDLFFSVLSWHDDQPRRLVLPLPADNENDTTDEECPEVLLPLRSESTFGRLK